MNFDFFKWGGSKKKSEKAKAEGLFGEIDLDEEEEENE